MSLSRKAFLATLVFLLSTCNAMSDQKKSGLYLGASLGGAWDKSENVEEEIGFGPSGWTWDGSDRSFIGGIFVGYNRAIANGFIVGVEADIEKSGLHVMKLMDDTGVPDPYYLQEWDSNWQGSARLRLGYSVGRTLFFATGGLAWADFQMKIYEGGSSTNFDKFSKNIVGWTIGGGVEHDVTERLAIRLEYRHTDFGTQSVIPAISDYSSGYQENYKVKQDAVRVGGVYGF